MFRLRCQRCLHFLGHAKETLQIVRLFKPSTAGAVPRTHERERRARCRGCGYVNVFHPLNLTAEQLVHNM